MNTAQQVIKSLAIAFAVLLSCGIFMGIISAGIAVSYVFGGWGSNTADIGMIEEIELDGATVQDLNALYIDVKVASVVIERGDEFKVEANEDVIQVRSSEKTLYIQEKEFNIFDGWDDRSKELRITIPKDWESLDILRLKNGAGRASVQGMKVRNLELDLGAGKTELRDVVITEKAKISTGAGYFGAWQAEIRNLHLDMGVGKVDFEVKLTGTGDIDAGVGKLDLRLLGDSVDYRVKVKKGLGSITLDGRKMSDGEVWGNGEVTVDIDGGVGAIDIRTE